ncbi:MAG: GSU2403 family nucleotidyltransferase fold protein [Noviherbaspirillum sp.]
MVNLPAPERYAIHKLLVYGERPVSERAKSRKDLLQAASLASYFLENGQATGSIRHGGMPYRAARAGRSAPSRGMRPCSKLHRHSPAQRSGRNERVTSPGKKIPVNMDG